jgi:glycosyltransferase involved in cell wall biosynthesis
MFTSEEALLYASRSGLTARPRRWWRPYAPEVAITAYKDVRELVRALQFSRDIRQLGQIGGNVKFVWQRHNLFATAGLNIARSLRCPLVLFVDAPTVWEDRKFGVNRPGWGKLIEAVGETPQFRRSDLIACVSDEVALEVCKRGAMEERVIITPNGVNLERFNPRVSGETVRQQAGLTERFVVGWMGSFRPFHGLDLTIKAAALLQRVVPNLALLLVGDGQERHRVQSLAQNLGLHVCFTGTVSHDAVPEYIAAMDVAVLASEATDGFHYSPMKLREYMACGRPTVAPRIGEIERLLIDGTDALLVTPGQPEALAQGIERLYRDDVLRLELGRSARAKVLACSWEHQVKRVWNRLQVGVGKS